MKPSKELDALVAEKVMGWELKPAPFGPSQDVYQCWHHDGQAISTIHITPRFSEDISTAWEVVDKLKSRDLLFSLRTKPDGRFRAMFFPIDKSEDDGEFKAVGDTAPHAICLAALKAVGVEVKYDR